MADATGPLRTNPSPHAVDEKFRAAMYDKDGMLPSAFTPWRDDYTQALTDGKSAAFWSFSIEKRFLIVKSS